MNINFSFEESTCKFQAIFRERGFYFYLFETRKQENVQNKFHTFLRYMLQHFSSKETDKSESASFKLLESLYISKQLKNYLLLIVYETKK